MPKEIDATEVQQELFAQFEQLVNQLGLMKNQITSMQQSIKHLEKSVKKQMKGLKKEAIKTKAKGNRAPSGFAKPSKVTKELCEFMNKTDGTEIARTEVTRALVAYIKENKLENIVYGLTKPLEQRHHPIKIVTHEWQSIWNDLKRPVGFKTKLKYLFMPPGWSHDGSTKTSDQLRAEINND